jgi:hypothetical protein
MGCIAKKLSSLLGFGMFERNNSRDLCGKICRHENSKGLVIRRRSHRKYEELLEMILDESNN